MSCRSSAGLTIFTLTNANRGNAVPPVVFPNMSLTQAFTFSIWVKATNNIPMNLMAYFGSDGSRMIIAHDGTNWIVSSRSGSVDERNHVIGPLVLNRWTFIGMARFGTNFHIYRGLQAADDTSPWTTPVTITEVTDFPTTIICGFNSFQIYVSTHNSVSSFKFWNFAVTLANLQTEGNRWDAGTAFWASTLRTPGDLSNIVSPYAARDWDHGHAYTSIENRSSLVYDNDPAYMANNTPCPTWVYPIPFPFADITVDPPGGTPLVTTTYKAPDFFQFADLGSVTPTDAQITDIVYYGLPFGGIDPGTPCTFTYGLYKNELNVELGTQTPSNIFDNGYSAVHLHPNLKASTMYLWKFGAQFVWNPVTPSGPTKSAHLSYILLYVTYIGYPLGVPALPSVDMAGLFAIEKDGQSIDQYNRGIQRNIPDPTIKTAYIGE